MGGNSLASSDYAAGTLAIVRYNLPSNRWELQNPLTAGAGMVYPGAGIPVSSGSAWNSSLSETDTYIIQGKSGAWVAQYPALTSAQGYLGSNVTMSSTTGTFYTGPSTGSLAAGTWLISGYVTLGKASATGQNLAQCEMTDGTTAFVSAESSINYVTSAAITYTVIPLTAIVTESGTATITINCENSVANGIIYASTPTSGIAHASSISALRVQ